MNTCIVPNCESTLSDEELVGRIRLGETELYGILIHRHSRRLHWALYHLRLSPDDSVGVPGSRSGAAHVATRVAWNVAESRCFFAGALSSGFHGPPYRRGEYGGHCCSSRCYRAMRKKPAASRPAAIAEKDGKP
jgi:hypothetical protein